MECQLFPTVNDLIDHACNQYRDLPAFTSLGHTVTYGDIDRLSRQFASYLQHHSGLKAGDRVAIQLPNILQYPVVMYGVVRAGLVIVNTNPLYTGPELLHQLRDSGAKMLITFANIAHQAQKVLDQTQVEKVLVTDLGELLPWPRGALVNFVVKHVKKMVPPFTIDNAISLRDALELGDQPLAPVTADKHTLLVLQYTGGTTGVAKGAMLSHGNLCTNVVQILDHMSNLFRTPSENIVAALPLYHIFAFNIHGLCAFAMGAHNILIPNPRDLPAFVKAIKPWPVSAFVAVNTLYNALARHEGFRSLDFSQLKTSAAGGMTVTEGVIRLWESLTGCTICEGYGLTETSPVVITNPDTAIRTGTIGTAVKDTEIKLIDEQGAAVAMGEPGELCVRGPQVMLGYWQRPEATAEAIDEQGWFRTGDIAVEQPDGYYKIVDRKKDMILVSGFNVYPNEVEEVVCLHPAVLECAVVGVPSDCTGEAVKLFVVLVEGESVTEQTLIEHCRLSLTAYKVPKLIEYRTSLPKTNVGKILRRELRESDSLKQAS